MSLKVNGVGHWMCFFRIWQVTLADPLSESFLPTLHTFKKSSGVPGVLKIPQTKPSQMTDAMAWGVGHGFLPQTPIHIVPICNFGGLSGEDHMVWFENRVSRNLLVHYHVPHELTGGLEHLDYFPIYRESWSQLTNSYFSEG